MRYLRDVDRPKALEWTGSDGRITPCKLLCTNECADYSTFPHSYTKRDKHHLSHRTLNSHHWLMTSVNYVSLCKCQFACFVCLHLKISLPVGIQINDPPRRSSSSICILYSSRTGHLMASSEKFTTDNTCFFFLLVFLCLASASTTCLLWSARVPTLSCFIPSFLLHLVHMPRVTHIICNDRHTYAQPIL